MRACNKAHLLRFCSRPPSGRRVVGRYFEDCNETAVVDPRTAEYVELYLMPSIPGQHPSTLGCGLQDSRVNMCYRFYFSIAPESHAALVRGSLIKHVRPRRPRSYRSRPSLGGMSTTEMSSPVTGFGSLLALWLGKQRQAMPIHCRPASSAVVSQDCRVARGERRCRACNGRTDIFMS